MNRGNRRQLIGVPLAVALLLSLAPQAPAAADPVIPTTGQIASSRQAAASKADQVSAIKAQLNGVQAELDRTQISMALAGQAYDAALVKLAAAQKALRTARNANAAAQAEVASAQRAVTSIT